MKTAENIDSTDNSRKKFVGFRVPVKQYITIVQAADNIGVSITDYVLSKIFPAVETADNTVQQNNLTDVKQVLNNSKQDTPKENPVLQPKNKMFTTDKNKKLFSDENEKLLHSTEYESLR